MNRFLCLHGLFQNNIILRKQMYNLLYKNNINGYFINAPHNVIPHYDKLKKLRIIYNNDFDDYKSWTQYPYMINKNDEKTLEYIADYLNDNKYINGIIGFSQGAMLLSIINTNYFYEKYNIKNNIKNIIFISGFMYNNNYVNNIYSTGMINTNNIHIIGKSDPIIVPSKSIKLTEYYNDPKIIYHERGHVIPKNICLI